MKKYRVKVNGKVYEVELEAVEEVSGTIEAPKASAPVASAPVSGGKATIVAPIGGKVLDIKVNVGDTVLVKVIKIDEKHRVDLMLKEVIKKA